MSQPPDDDEPDHPYGRPSYLAPPYGPPGRQRPPAALPAGAPPGRRPRTAIALGALGTVAVLAIAGAAFLLLGRGDGGAPGGGRSSSAAPASAERTPTARTTAAPVRPFQPRSTRTSVPRATLPPDHLGSDPAFDRLARRCFDGDMQACDDLFADSASNSLYEAYGDTCAGRQAPATDLYCTAAFPGS